MSLIQQINRKRPHGNAFRDTTSTTSSPRTSSTPMLKSRLQFCSGISPADPICLDSDNEQDTEDTGHYFDRVSEQENPFSNKNAYRLDLESRNLSSDWRGLNVPSTTDSDSPSDSLRKRQRVRSPPPPQLANAKITYRPFFEVRGKPSEVQIPVIRSQIAPDDEDNGHFKVSENTRYSRFVIKKLLGQGTFGKVVHATDPSGNAVAIKIIKAIPKYKEAAKIELRVLKTLHSFDPTNRNGCIHFREVFEYGGHVLIVTNLFSESVYDFHEANHAKSFPGLHLQSIAKQLLRSVAFLHDLGIIHTDLKPENTLLVDLRYSVAPYCTPGKVSQRNVLRDTEIRLIDFGLAVFDTEYHPDLVLTRHYRAPEILFGIGWSFECDMWSVGCILAELLLGLALFNTHDAREHLLMMERVVNQRVDAALIKSCCPESSEACARLRAERRPYELYGRHYTSLRKEGYGAVPSTRDDCHIHDDVYRFLRDRGETYIREEASKAQKSLPKKRQGSESLGSYFPTGLRKVRSRLPKDLSKKMRKNVSEMAPIEELVSMKVGILLDTTLPVTLAYFKYCLGFSDGATNALLKAGANGRVPDSLRASRRFKNLNSVAGGCLNGAWVRSGGDKTAFFSALKRQIADDEGVENLLSEAMFKKLDGKLEKTCMKVADTYPQSAIEAGEERHVNGRAIAVARIGGPVDFDTFKFWFDFVDLLKRLLVFNPYERLTACEAMEHEWFNDGVYDDGTVDYEI